MANLLPLFPLPNVVLFPGVFLPLHIFESRYRAMIGDALGGDKRIGMALLKPGWEPDYEGRPQVFPIACSGIIVHDERLDDGRYNIVLRGLERVRIVAENHERPYRRAAVETVPDLPLDERDRPTLNACRRALEAELAALVSRGRGVSSDAVPAASMDDEALIHTLAQYLDLEPIEKQALLQIDGLLIRARALVELLEMKRLSGGTQGWPDVSH